MLISILILGKCACKMSIEKMVVGTNWTNMFKCTKVFCYSMVLFVLVHKGCSHVLKIEGGQPMQFLHFKVILFPPNAIHIFIEASKIYNTQCG